MGVGVGVGVGVGARLVRVEGGELLEGEVTSAQHVLVRVAQHMPQEGGEGLRAPAVDEHLGKQPATRLVRGRGRGRGRGREWG